MMSGMIMVHFQTDVIVYKCLRIYRKIHERREENEMTFFIFREFYLSGVTTIQKLLPFRHSAMERSKIEFGKHRDFETMIIRVDRRIRTTYYQQN